VPAFVHKNYKESLTPTSNFSKKTSLFVTHHLLKLHPTRNSERPSAALARPESYNMDFTKPNWLDNWQPLQEFATSSLTDLNFTDILSPIG
jgi:hypothetical protein